MKRTALLLALALLVVSLVYWTSRGGAGAPSVEVERTSPADPTPSSPTAPESELQLSQQEDEPVSQQSSERIEVPIHVEPGPCRIDGTVVRRVQGVDTPLAGVDVLLTEDRNPGEFNPRPGTTRLEYRALSRTKSDATGSFTFDGILGTIDGHSGVQYRVIARLADGAERSVLVQVSEKYPRREPTLVFGSARIRGILFGVDGRPIEGARVLLKTADDLVGYPEYVWRATDASGNYSFEALRAGQYSVLVTAPNELSPASGWPGRSHIIQLAEGEDLTLDAGSSDGCPTWRGKVRSCPGTTVTGSVSIQLMRTIELPLGTEVLTMVSRQFDGEQGFALQLEAGDWTPILTGHGSASWKGKWLRDPPVRVPPSGLIQDLIPGHRLEGRILVEGTGQCLRGSAPGKVHVYVSRLGEVSEKRQATVDELGSFTFEMLEEGDWLARVTPLKLTAADGWVKFQIVAGDTRHGLDLEVRAP